MPLNHLSPLDILRRPLFLPLLALIASILIWDSLRGPVIPETLLGKESAFEGTLAQAPSVKDGKIKLTVRLDDDNGQVLLTALPPPGSATIPFKPGDRIAFTAKLKKPTAYRNPGSFDYERYLRRKGIGATGFIENSDSIRLVQAAPLNAWQRFEQDTKNQVRAMLARQTTPEIQGVLIALLWGEESGLDAATEDLFRRHGLSHLLVISGLHFTILAWLLFRVFLLGLRPFSRVFLHIPAQKLAAVGSLVLFSAYYAFCEPGPSVLRAYIAVTCYGIAFLLNRSKDLMNILFLAAFLILTMTPEDLFNPSFQFSFIAVLSIVLIFPRLKERLIPEKRHPAKGVLIAKIGDLFLVNLAIFIGLTPFTVFYFHEVQATGLFMNLWAVPLIEMIIVPSGLVALTAGLVWEPLSAALFHVPIALTELMLRFLKASDGILPQPKLAFPPHGWELALYCILILTLALSVPRKIKWAVASALLAVFLLDAAWIAARWHGSQEFKITQLDVGQGDALVLRLPGPAYALVDGGGSPYFDLGKNVILPFLLHERIPRLDAVAVTHADTDHYLGLKAVIERYEVGQVLWSGAPNSDPAFGEFLQTVQGKGIALKALRSGDGIHLGGARLDAVWPAQKLSEKDNNRSLVLRVSAQGRSALLTGDIESLVEWQLVQAGGLKAVDYLKVPHHGSQSSSSEDFLGALLPKIASIGCGIANRFGHPHPKILERFRRIGTKVYRTDLSGAVEIDLGNLEAKPFTGN